ncbi:sensor histidine kinase [Zymomonas mobilis subsp. pomaceae]|uniref:histidine kinase n=2 Tax=Zymomonas mobilis TaxID=542 RepID=F8ESN8_ZYMMT|nr:integral membrane sensor signal transduction histidine kinase [Zymomonas mobilis subsp. pomaceae ATCC 29192]GEB89816.1 sensor histidine kinase [Zymomonas mobilis subsp. pomaceae]
MALGRFFYNKWNRFSVFSSREVASEKELIMAAPVEDDLPLKPTGSLTQRLIAISAFWIFVLLLGGGLTLDRVLTQTVTDNFDSQLDYVLAAMIASSEIDPEGAVRLNRPLGDQRFLEAYSGLYFQISGNGYERFPSPSLWDRFLHVSPMPKGQLVRIYDSNEFSDGTLRIMERDVRLPGSPVLWRFQVAEIRTALDNQIKKLRHTLFKAFLILGSGLIVITVLQVTIGLWPLRKLRVEISAIRNGQASRIRDRMPNEVAPLIEELNALLRHNERQAEEARRHAGNLAHALKTPLTVITNEANADSAELKAVVLREVMTMRRHVDHHLARARAIGRRGNAQSQAEVWPSLLAVERAVTRLYPHATIDLAGVKDAVVRIERQDLDEILGNLIENAAKYGQGRVFVTVERNNNQIEILIEDDGTGIPENMRGQLFKRGARLDTGKPGTGLGLAIVRDVVEIYGGQVVLEESEDLGGLFVRLTLPMVK